MLIRITERQKDGSLWTGPAFEVRDDRHAANEVRGAFYGRERAAWEGSRFVFGLRANGAAIADVRTWRAVDGVGAPGSDMHRCDPAEKPTGECPYGCGEPCYAWGSRALPDGYVDACREHAPDALRETIADLAS